MRLQIIPNINIDNTKVLGLVENIHLYRPLLRRIHVDKEKISFEDQYYFAFEIIITKDNVLFYIIFDDQLKDSIETELNICWKQATFKQSKDIHIFQHIREMEPEEHYFLSLKTDLRGEYPLSNLLETQAILRNEEKILIRIQSKPSSYTWYREIEECIKDFEKGKMTLKSNLSVKKIGFKAAEVALDIAYFAMDFVNDIITDIPLEHDQILNNKYSKLFRTGLSDDTKTKSKYNGYQTKIIVGVNSDRKEMLFRNIEKAFGSMNGDNKLFMVDKCDYKYILSSKEIAQMIQMPTKYYQQIYKINNVDKREVDVPIQLQNGLVRIGIAEKQGKEIPVYWSHDKNIMALAKLFVGCQNAGKTTAVKRTVKECHKAGYSNIVIDYIEDCATAKDIAEIIPENEKVIVKLGYEDFVPALAYNEVSRLITEDMNRWERVRLANLLSEQVEYLINAVTDDATGELTAPMLRYLHAACMITFIRPNAKLSEVFTILRRWDKRNEAIRYAKYSKCFDEDDDIFFDLDELHKRDKDAKIVGTREDLIIGITNRIILLQKNPYIKQMLSAEIDTNQNFTKYIEQGKSIFIMIPQNKFPNPMVRDILTTFYISRIWLTVQLRENNIAARLCNVIFDEVHQVPTTARFLSNHITEFRRHRLGLILTCHFLKQLKDLLPSLKSSGASYVLIAGTEKENLDALKEELAPFTIEEGLSLKPYTSINIINYGNQYARFITRLPIK